MAYQCGQDGWKTDNERAVCQIKEPFVTKSEPVDIIGFYSEHHVGVFLAEYAPAIKERTGIKNAIHIHLVSRVSRAAGHIDDITLGEDMVLRLPKS